MSSESRAFEEVLRLRLDEFFKLLIKKQGFTSTLRSLQKGRVPSAPMMTVTEGVLQEQPSGLYDAALQTEHGRFVFRNAQRTDRPATARSNLAADSPRSSAELVGILKGGTEAVSPELVCEVEVARFDESQKAIVLPSLWDYIQKNKNSNDRDVLIGVGAAIRKYVALMSMGQIGQVAELLDPAQQAPLPIELELEVVKMIFRNFEALPPTRPNPVPVLGARLWEMVQSYGNPRILLRDKYSAVASLAIEAIVAMCSDYAIKAWRFALDSPFTWFGEMVSDDLDALQRSWMRSSPSAAKWLDDLRHQLKKE